MSSRREKTRENLLEAAWQRLERGDAATLEEVASDAGVSRQALYLHFGSRGGLLLALVSHIDAKLGLNDRLREALEPDDAALQLKRLMALTAEYQHEIHGVAMALVRLSERDEDVRAALEDRMQARRRGYGEMVKRLAAEKRLKDEWSHAEIVDALWEAGAPSSYQHLVVERGWKPSRYADWLIWLAQSFLKKR